MMADIVLPMPNLSMTVPLIVLRGLIILRKRIVLFSKQFILICVFTCVHVRQGLPFHTINALRKLTRIPVLFDSVVDQTETRIH